MAELLLRVKDRVNDDPTIVPSLAGDVIHIAPDGWGWTPLELANPDWRVVKLPGVEPERLTHLLEAQMLGGSLAQRRVKAIDVNMVWLMAKIGAHADVVELSGVEVGALFAGIVERTPIERVEIG